MKLLLSRVLKAQSGNVAMMTALAMPIVIGAAGFGVETAYWFQRDVILQQSADKAVYAAAIERRAGSSSTVIDAAAVTYATKNGYTPGTLAVNYPPTQGAYKGNSQAIEVVLTSPIQRFFSQVFSNSKITATKRAVALMQTSSNACVLALSKTAARAINVSGNNSLSMQGCNLMSNSVASDAVYVNGSAQLSTDCLIAVGGASVKSGTTTLNACPNVITQAPPAGDPYASLPVPTSGTTWNNTNPPTLSPGNYPNGMNLNGTTTLNPGTYIVTGGSFKLGAQANVKGTGVTIYLAAGVSLSMNGGAKVKLQAPTSGTYSGVLFFGARDSTASVTINGDASASLLTGALYFPNQDVNYLGNFSGLDGCTRVVASTVQWSGSSAVAQDCVKYGMAPIPAIQIVKLVE